MTQSTNNTNLHWVNQCNKYNKLELSSILQCGLPWLRLNKSCPEFTTQEINDTLAQAANWTINWPRAPMREGEDVGGWAGVIGFGPKNQQEWQQIVNDDNRQNEVDIVLVKNRHKKEFDWVLPESNPIRQWISTWIRDDALNLVNFLTLPPGGYYWPHRDQSNIPSALTRIYIPLNWPDGNTFSVLDFGNMPIKLGDVFIIENNKFPHWVNNPSSEARTVLTISANLTHLSGLIKESFLRSTG